jgi:hypothetical protein
MNTDKTKSSFLGVAYPRSSAFIRGHSCFGFLRGNGFRTKSRAGA